MSSPSARARRPPETVTAPPEDERRDGNEDALAGELAEGALDPDEVPSWLEPWDEGSDDE
jgi:hypothetical protein